MQRRSQSPRRLLIRTRRSLATATLQLRHVGGRVPPPQVRPPDEAPWRATPIPRSPPHGAAAAASQAVPRRADPVRSARQMAALPRPSAIRVTACDVAAPLPVAACRAIVPPRATAATCAAGAPPVAVARPWAAAAARAAAFPAAAPPAIHPGAPPDRAQRATGADFCLP